MPRLIAFTNGCGLGALATLTRVPSHGISAPPPFDQFDVLRGTQLMVACCPGDPKHPTSISATVGYGSAKVRISVGSVALAPDADRIPDDEPRNVSRADRSSLVASIQASAAASSTAVGVQAVRRTTVAATAKIAPTLRPRMLGSYPGAKMAA
jgi:hypothetical protein